MNRIYIKSEVVANGIVGLMLANKQQAVLKKSTKGFYIVERPVEKKEKA